jgi:septal ring factor EnvC (AmiA/AmiB activator)
MGQGSLRLVFALLIAAAFAAPALAAPDAADAQQRLDGVQKALQDSIDRQKSLKDQDSSLEQQGADLRRQRVEAAGRIQDFEFEASNLEGRLAVLARDEQQKAAVFAESREQMGRILMALERMARYPPEAVIAQPGSPNDLVRSAVLLRTTVPRLEAQAQVLRNDLADLQRVRSDITARKRELTAATEGLRKERLQLASLIERNTAARTQSATDQRQAEREAQSLAREAKDLLQLMDQIERDRQKREEQAKLALKSAPPSRPSAAKPAPSTSGLAPGSLIFPAVGDVVATYGQPTDTGISRKGIDIATRPDAQVVAPLAGTVVFAGEFRGYGQLLIIEHGGGYHSLLAGMARIDAGLGQKVDAGEPVAVMAEGPGKPALYLELRRNGQPINPLPWLAARNNKVSG